jgi:hypothetical protein
MENTNLNTIEMIELLLNEIQIEKSKIIELIKQYPDDIDLGREVRKLFEK